MSIFVNLVSQIKVEKKITSYSLIVSVLYGLIYYWSTGYIIIGKQTSLSWLLIKN